MAENLLILGGTLDAAALCRALRDVGRNGVVSLAGRVKTPRDQALPVRLGGFGGVQGLQEYIRDNRITHVIDATHPFAAQMSRNAAAACARTGVPLAALTRPDWQPKAGDTWHHVPDIPAAVAALRGPAKRVMLAIGRMHLAAFSAQPQHHYLLRLVDAPAEPLPFADCHVELARGPFAESADRALLSGHRIDLVVSKNSGGTGAYAKIAAARSLGLPVVMIDRPEPPERVEFHSIAEILDWLDHSGTDLGV